MVSVQNRSWQFSPTIRANVRLQNFIFKNDFTKMAQQANIFDLLDFDFYSSIYRDIWDDHRRRVLCSLQFNKHVVVLLHGQERWRMPINYFFPRKNAFPTIFLMLPLVVNPTMIVYSFKTKRKSCNHSSKNVGLRSSCKVFPLLRSDPLSFFKNYCIHSHLLVRYCLCICSRWTI